MCCLYLDNFYFLLKTKATSYNHKKYRYRLLKNSNHVKCFFNSVVSGFFPLMTVLGQN